MIYVCIPSHNEAATVGLLLWKIRQVFAGFPREYQLLVLDDGSTDATGEILEPYSRVLPLTVVRHAGAPGLRRRRSRTLLRTARGADRPAQAGRRHPDARRFHPQPSGHPRSGAPDRERRRHGRRRRHAGGRALAAAPDAPPVRAPAAAWGRDGAGRARPGLRLRHRPAGRAPERDAEPSERLPGDRRLGGERGALLADGTLRPPGGGGSVGRAARSPAAPQPHPAGGRGAQPLASTLPVPCHPHCAARRSRSARDTEHPAAAVSS